MKRILTAGTFVVGIALLSGCTVHGKWDLATVEPTAAQRDVEFRSLRLDKDGSFYAEATEGTGIKTTSGTYTYEDSTLSLVSHDGERHTYDARFIDATHLQLTGHWQGRKLQMKYIKKNDTP